MSKTLDELRKKRDDAHAELTHLHRRIDNLVDAYRASIEDDFRDELDELSNKATEAHEEWKDRDYWEWSR